MYGNYNRQGEAAMLHSKAPWIYDGPRNNIHVVQEDEPHMRVCFLTSDGPTVANAKLICASPDLLEAALLLEQAEDDRQRCYECEGEGEPEACAKCFPAFDTARVKRRMAIAKAGQTA
jgi:hypothetical protein